jgi:very-short-patch-repair endonuclease
MASDMNARVSEWQKSLLDTTKRNRLIKFAPGRGGGLILLHPTADHLWRGLVVEGQRLTFPWKRDLLGVSAESIDGAGDRMDSTEVVTEVESSGKVASALPPSLPEAPDDVRPDGKPAAESRPVVGAGVDPEPAGGAAPTPALHPESEVPAATEPTHEPSAVNYSSQVEGYESGDAPPNASHTPRPKTLRELTAECLASRRLGDNDLLTDLSDKKLATHLLRLSRAAAEAETDHGVSTLYAAFGFLRWYESADSQEEILSPLVLVPIRLSRESVESTWTVQAGEDEPAVNRCLGEALATEFRLRLPSGADADISTDGPNGLGAYLERVADLVRELPRWGVVSQAGLGLFNFQKLAMWQDLKKNSGRIEAHDLCRAIAGDALAGLRAPPGLMRADELDARVSPETVTHILDADSSQHEALEAVKGGADVVIDGPPGTGKSQTIANAIAELLAAGRTILFVSEKTAALEVVKRRLDERGLGDFCLELHSHKANKREVAAELGRCLDLAPEPGRNVATELRQLADDRHRLNAYAAELHRTRAPLGMSAYQVHGELARAAELPDRSRWTAPDVLSRDAEFLRRATDVLNGLSRCRAVIDNPNTHPWRGCRLTAVTQAGLEDTRHHLGVVADATARLSEGTTLTDLALAGPADTVGRWRAAVEFARSVLAVPPLPPEWFEGDPAEAARAARALHAATAQVRDLNSLLGAFPANAELDEVAVSKFKAPSAGRRDRLLGGESLSARARAGRFRALAKKLTTVLPVAEQFVASFQRLTSALRFPARNATAAQAGKYARVADALAAGPAVLPAWWDTARRPELQIVVAKAAEEELAAQSLRAVLIGKLSPAAFAPEAASVVRHALRSGGSFWGRLLPRWAALRRQVAGWYTDSPPDRAAMLADLATLEEFHRRSGYARQVEAAYADALVTTATGRADWAASSEGIRAVERYEKWKPSAELRAALAPGGELDREALRAAAAELSSADSQFQGAWSDLLTVYCADAETLDAPVADLVLRLREECEAAEFEATALEQLIGLLRDGVDLPPGTWVTRANELAERAALRAQIAARARVLGHTPSIKDPEAVDWSAPAEAAAAFLDLVIRANVSFSAATVAALCDGMARDRVRAAVNVSERVLATGFEASWTFLAGGLFSSDSSVSEGVVLSQAAIVDLCTWTRARLADLQRVEEWVRYGQVRRVASDLGIDSVVEEVATGRVGIDRAADAFRRRFLGLWLDALFERVPELARFSTDEQDHLIKRFARLDRLSIQSAPARLRSQLLSDPRRPRSAGDAPASSELGVLLREANKKRKHMPVRKLFAAVPTLLPRLKPCLMMSPLAVSTYLDGTTAEFDVVIFDEASQVRPHDAICAVYRGRQLVVAGDPRQLPPTDFFARATADDPDSEDRGGGTAGFESLLDVCLALGLVRKQLRWHYRSRREGLIAFANRFIYGGGLVTFPSADDGTGGAVRFERVVDGRFADGVNVTEARRVADLVVAHARSSPDTSLGVIAFSQRQQNRILDELEARRKRCPDLEEFFKEDRPERFFVKNLENVQGDERDVIILSVGYGPNETGRVAMQFGPLNRQGGERRLNVAVTRARCGMTVVTSMVAADIDLSRTGAEGVKLLRAFLDYAERGPRALDEAVSGAEEGAFDSPFERAVYEELRRQGLTLHTQVGCGGFKIDMAVLAPGTTGRYALGVECDGATYHSSATARDRDRLRQAVLEGLGWRLCRIWSTDWLRNCEKQVQRVLTALAAALEATPAAPIVETPPNPVEVVPPPVARTPAPTPSYASIEDVPEPVVREAVVAVVSEYGSTESDDLCGAVARRLGFKRLGTKIKSRIEQAMTALERGQQLQRQADGRWSAFAVPTGRDERR